MILSEIEQKIKRKIEAVGTPLKDWDIQINYGIKTGFNDAFIISTEKRDEILSKCQTRKERTRTEELIRPILRGRDIQRYGYGWADLWLIATFPSRNYDIDQYPAVKKHLLSFGIKRLEQTGKRYVINGEEIKARKRTNNKWFEVQDSISYWEDFSRPVITWQRITKENTFCLTKPGMLVLDSMAFISCKSEKISKYLTAVLNSKLVAYWVNKNVPQYGDTGYRLANQFVELIPVPIPARQKSDSEYNDKIDFILSLFGGAQKGCTTDISTIDSIIFSLYGLSNEEVKLIESRQSQ